MKRSRRYIFFRSANIPLYVCAAHPYRWNSALGHPFRRHWSDLLFPENVRGILAPRPVSHFKTFRLHRCDLCRRRRDRGFYPLGQSLVNIHDFYSGCGPEKECFFFRPKLAELGVCAKFGCRIKAGGRVLERSGEQFSLVPFSESGSNLHKT